jgi:hypothetical protein
MWILHLVFPLLCVPSCQTRDVKVILSKTGSHHLDEEEDFYTMREALLDVVDHYFEYDLTTTASG